MAFPEISIRLLTDPSSTSTVATIVPAVASFVASLIVALFTYFISKNALRAASENAEREIHERRISELRQAMANLLSLTESAAKTEIADAEIKKMIYSDSVEIREYLTMA